MLFSSVIFIYYFLPIFLFSYFIVPKKYKNTILLLFSLLFYTLGEPIYVIVLIISCVINYYLSILIDKGNNKKVYLIFSIIYNVGSLLIFKYTDFFIDNINNIFNLDIAFLYIVMPIGISFYTFQALGYVIDVYRCNHKPAKNVFDFITYVSLFPQLIAGPIVRYSDIEEKLYNRKMTLEGFGIGVKRFIIGLSKKVLIANVLGEISKNILEVTVLSSWLKPVMFTLQIYFDFSGYSDMAIGLGHMIGFKFLENFNYPLIASSITDFWRRWHISLSSWFKDYVYIPLGGNRVGKFKWIRNIFIVWFLTGFWHGASWNFIIWGLYFGIILTFEKLFLKKYLDKTKVIKYIYSLIIIIVSFMIFNASSTIEIVESLKNMFFVSEIPLVGKESIYHFKSNFIFLIVSIVAATPLVSILLKKLENTKIQKIIYILEIVIYVVLLILCTAFLIDESFNPFLYFRF